MMTTRATLLLLLALAAAAACAARGGWEEVDVRDPAVAAAAEHAAEQMNDAAGEPPRVVSARRRAAGHGTTYQLSLESASRGRATVTLREGADKSFRVLETRGSNAQAGAKGTHPRAGVPLGGGFRDADPGSDEVRRAAEFAVAEANARSDSLTPYTLARVVSARTQVVAGINYLLVLAMDADDRREYREVIVWNRFGDLKLTNSRVCKDERCGRGSGDS